MADSMEPCKMLWADPCCHGNEIWARRGDPVAYRLVAIPVCEKIRAAFQGYFTVTYTWILIFFPAAHATGCV